MAEYSTQSGRFAAIDPTTFGKSFAPCRARSFTTASLAAGFLAQHTEDNEKRVLCSIGFETAPPETQEGLRKAMEKEWEKFLRFGAVVVIEGAEKDGLLQQGHVMIPSKGAHVDKNAFKKHAPDYQPKWKSRFVSCGNFQHTHKHSL